MTDRFVTETRLGSMVTALVAGLTCPVFFFIEDEEHVEVSHTIIEQ